VIAAPPRRPGVHLASSALRFAALVATLGLVSGCSRDGASEVRVSGQIEATEVRLATKVAGTIASRPVDEGDLVARGALVAVIDTVDLDLERRSSAAERDRAAAQLQVLLAGSRVEDVRAARAMVASREADLALATKDDERIAALYERGVVAAAARDQARARREVAQAAQAQAAQDLARVERGARPEDRAAARASLAAAQAKLDAVKQRIHDAVIVSPLSGTVTSKLVEPGELVAAGAGVVVISDLEHPWLTAFVTGEDLPRVRVGAKARVTTDAKGDRGREGTVSYVSPTAEFTPRNVQTRDERAKLVYRVKIRVGNPDGAFKPGMPADAVIEPGINASREARVQTP
jgi:HlyD family secretion protein